MEFNALLGIISGFLIAVILFFAAYKWHKGKGARKGRKGEKIVSRELHSLKRRDNTILNDVLLPTKDGHTSQIDHIVVSTRGIFVIETKSISGRIRGSEHSQYWTRHYSGGSSRFYNPILQNNAHVKVLRRLLPTVDPSAFFSLIVFTEARNIEIKADDIIVERFCLPDRHIRRTFLPSERRKRRWWRFGKEIRLDESVAVVNLEELTNEINRRPRLIPREELDNIVTKIEDHSLTSHSERRAHVRYARQTSRNISREISQGICPRCGGKLVILKGRTGEFAGCENYPECKFTCSIDLMK